MPSIEQWLAHFRSESIETRIRSARVLLQRADETPLPVLLEILDLPTRHGLHWWAVRALQSGTEAALEAEMIGRLESPDPIRRGAAVNILGSMGTENAVQPLLRMIDDPQVMIRADAVAALDKLGDPSAIPVLERQLAGRQTDSVNVKWRLESALDRLRAIRDTGDVTSGASGLQGKPPPASGDKRGDRR